MCVRVQRLPRGEEEGDVRPRLGGVVGGRDVNLDEPILRAVRHARSALEELEEIGGKAGVFDLDSHMNRQRIAGRFSLGSVERAYARKSRLRPPKDRDDVQPYVSRA
jgi:hypothetical protein